MFPLYIWFEISALLTSIVCYKSLSHVTLKYFIPFLFVIVLYELYDYWNFFTINKSNHWSLNIITTLEFSFYAFYIRSQFVNLMAKKIALFAIIATLCLIVINIAFIQGVWKLHSYTLLLAFLVLIFLSCLFFSDLISVISKKSVTTNPHFWIVTGILFFCLGQFVFFCFFEYVTYTKDYVFAKLFRLISLVSNLILYSLMIIGFICQRQAVSKSLSQ
jgi:hypothetical protein